jgi:hypothetical protein
MECSASVLSTIFPFSLNACLTLVYDMGAFVNVGKVTPANRRNKGISIIKSLINKSENDRSKIVEKRSKNTSSPWKFEP